jgi:hypothetical protein
MNQVKLPALNVTISIAKKRDIAELTKEMDQFYSPMIRTNTPESEIILIARENVSGKRRIVGYSQNRIINDGVERIGNGLIFSVRKGFKNRHIGSKLLGKINSYYISKGIKRAELFSFNERFYLKTNYRPKLSDLDDFGSSMETLEANLKRKEAREKILKKRVSQRQSLAPQNVLNKDRLLKARRKLK